MAGTEQFDPVLATPETRAGTNGQRQLPEEAGPSLSDTMRAMERFQAMRDAGASVMRHKSHWILGNH